jgi:hypothetical protein
MAGLNSCTSPAGIILVKFGKIRAQRRGLGTGVSFLLAHTVSTVQRHGHMQI